MIVKDSKMPSVIKVFRDDILDFIIEDKKHQVLAKSKSNYIFGISIEYWKNYLLGKELVAYPLLNKGTIVGYGIPCISMPEHAYLFPLNFFI